MANIPTYNDLYTAILSDIESKAGVTIPSYGKNFLRVLAAVQAGKLKIYYLLIGKLQKNIFVDTAESESIGGTLERFGRVKLGRNPFPATAGEYTVSVSGTAGAVIPENTTFKSNDDATSPGFLYVLDTAYTLTGSGDTISLRSLNAGLDYRLSVSDKLTVTAPIALVDDLAIVTSEDVIPQSEEDLEDYRRKVIEAYRLEAQGGAGADYRIWSADVQSVEQVYPFTATGVNNEVDLYIEATIADSTDGKGTPSSTTLSDVEDAIELPTTTRPSRKPLGVYEVNYIAVTPLDIDITITDGIDPFTATEQTTIFNTIKSYLEDIRPFVSSIDVLSEKNDTFDTNKIISLIIESVPGKQFGAVSMDVDGNPETTFTFDYGDIPYLNTISYI